MKLQLKRSNVLDLGVAKEPTAAQMEYGELAVNYNNGDPAIFLKDSNDNIIRIAGTGNINSGDNPSGDTLPPTGNQIGDMFFHTTNNTMYYWDGSEWVPIANDVTAADIFVGTLAEIDAEVPAPDRRNGFLWWNVEDGTLYIWYIDVNTSQFVVAIPSTGGGSGGGANVAVLNTPPTSPDQGDMWWNTVDGRLYIWYQDVDSGQWVDASPDSQTSPITSGEDFPTDAIENDCFFNTTDGRLYIYYNDGNSLQWVDASPDSQAEQYWDRTGTTLSPVNAEDDVTIDGEFLSGQSPYSGAGVGSAIDRGGIACTKTDGGSALWAGYIKGDGSTTSRINADGSADFASAVRSTNGSNQVYIVSSGIAGGSSTVDTFTISSNDGSAKFGGENITMNSNGTTNQYNTAGYSQSFTTVNDSRSWVMGRTPNDTAFYLRDGSGGVGVVMTRGATAWVPFASDSKLKTISGAVDPIQAWNLIKNIELKRYQYKDQETVPVSYAGPMADWLSEQDPELLIELPNNITYNKELLEIKALQALSTALTRIEELEARLTAAGL